MARPKKGCQAPTQLVVLKGKKSYGAQAVKYYAKTGRKAQTWQTTLLRYIMTVNKDGLWTHTKCGYSVPRRNGKSEILVARELWGLINNERILHTAHRTTTSHTSWEKLVEALSKAGYEEKKDFKTSKQFGLETITMLKCDGKISFRTRSSKGGLGEGYDLLIIDEAQEYTDDQASALKYVVTDSKNPQTIMCGTPPTPVSAGTVFANMRNDALAGITDNTFWAEWSVDQQTDPYDIAAWYRSNPSLGYIFTERSIKDEISGDIIDFNIQRLGLWIRYNLKSAISENEWMELKSDAVPQFAGKLYVGIKYGSNGINAAMSIAVKTTDGRIFVESIDCRPVRFGTDWLVTWLARAQNVAAVVIDGANGQQVLVNAMKDAKLKIKPTLPTVSNIIVANAMFEQRLYDKTLCHSGQPSLVNVISNCDKRPIGSNGGFGYKALKPDTEIALMDSVILAQWAAGEAKEHAKQRVSY